MSWKTLEESLKAVKQELKAEKRRSQHLSEVINGMWSSRAIFYTNHGIDMKRESKKNQEKLSNQMDTKLRNIDETRKGAELQIEVMSRTNADLMAKYVILMVLVVDDCHLDYKKRKKAGELQQLNARIFKEL